jgi:protein TonB
MLRAGLPPANDRMLTTCFLAALFHGIVILGVTFSSSSGKSGGNDAPALEVILVNDQAPSVAANPNAQYLSERSQRGSGNTLKRERALIPKSSLMPVERSGIPSGAGLAALQAGANAGDEELVSTQQPGQKILYFASSTAAKESSELPLLLEKRPDLAMTPNDDGVELRMRGEASALDRRGHPRIRRCRLPGQLAPQDRARGHDEFSRRRAAPETLRNSGDRSHHRIRRQASANGGSA